MIRSVDTNFPTTKDVVYILRKISGIITVAAVFAQSHPRRQSLKNEMLYQKVLTYLTKLTAFEIILVHKRCEDLLHQRMKKPSKAIDKMVDESKEELDCIYERFKNGQCCCCPLCKTMGDE